MIEGGSRFAAARTSDVPPSEKVVGVSGMEGQECIRVRQLNLTEGYDGEESQPHQAC